MFLMLFTHYLFGYVGKQDFVRFVRVDLTFLFLCRLGTVLCSVGLILALCSVYVFTRRQMVNFIQIEIISFGLNF